MVEAVQVSFTRHLDDNKMKNTKSAMYIETSRRIIILCIGIAWVQEI